MNPADSSADDFRIVDLFSPSDERLAPSASHGGAAHVTPPRVGGEMPSSFLFTNPIFVSDRSVRDGERR